jgi:hypothetical protein
MSWIDLSAIWRIVVFGMIAGAGGGGTHDDALIGGDPVGMIVAVIAFLIVLAAIGWGIYEIYTLGHPHK